jgi:NADPH:quinone reductase-like Zn-dependent oxidoreductase
MIQQKNTSPKTVRTLKVLTKGASNYEIKPHPLPTLKQNEVLVKVHAVPITPVDISRIAKSFTGDFIPGIECSGTVVDGKGDKAVMCIGKQVVLATHDGLLQDYVVTNADNVMFLKNKISPDEAACGYINAITAVALVDFAEKFGAKAIVNTAANSSSGRNIIRVCKKKNIPLINIVRSHERLAELQELGCEHILDQTEPDFEARLKSLVENLNASVAFDCVSGDLCVILAKVLPKDSLIISYGSLGNEQHNSNYEDQFYMKKHKLQAFSAIAWLKKMNAEEREKLFKFIRNNFEALFKPRVEAKYSWKDYAESLIKAQEHLDGKKVLVVPDE